MRKVAFEEPEDNQETNTTARYGQGLARSGHPDVVKR